MVEVVDEARAAHARRDWPTAFELFTQARRHGQLAAADLDALSDAAWWLGEVEASLQAAEAAFRAYLDADERRAAAMTAIDAAVTLFLRGDESRGSGWLGRAARLLEELPEGPEHGYLCYLTEVEAGLAGGDLDAVVAAASEVRRIARAHGDPNLDVGALVGEGRARIRLGDVDSGLRLLDEAMLNVVHDDLDPEWAGNAYCHLMAACHELADIRRAREWTQATAAWVAGLPAAVLFAGICRVHRSQVLQITGEWDQAEVEAGRVVDELAHLHVASVAEAHYQLGELWRLRGAVADADAAYGRARELGRDPQPGLALLHLARGRADDAATSIRTALLAVIDDRLARARLCAAQVEIALACGDLDEAARACAELEGTAASVGTSGLEAAALHWRGALALAADRAEEALPALRAACRRWHAVHAPYDAARAGVLLGRAYEQLGDHEAAAAEFAASRETFEQLGASVDLRALADHTGAHVGPGGLTAREIEVLRLVATGRTNREVAEHLVLSEKTVARHLSNIFTKLGVSTRTEAAAFAFVHGLAQPGTG